MSVTADVRKRFLFFCGIIYIEGFYCCLNYLFLFIKNVTKKISKISLIFFIFLVLPKIAFGAPSITGVSGNISNGESITISGSGFGSTGPNVVLFDSFEKGNIGSNISTVSNSADIGNWDALGNTEQTYSTESFLSGDKSMKVDFSQNGGSGPMLNYPNVQNSDIFLSWWQYMPINRDVPGTNNVDGPNWKWFWIGDETDSWPFGSDYVTTCLSNDDCDGIIGVFPADDLEAPEREGGTWFDSSFAKGTWMRVSVAMKNATSGAYLWNQEISTMGNFVKFNLNNIVTAHSDDPWNVLTLPGYGRDDNNAVAYYDDVYIATGDSARARVEIGNAPTYSASTNLTLLTPTDWSDGSITATIREGSFTSGSNVYLYLVDSTGTVNADGYPITIGSVLVGDTTAPAIPSGLNIL